MRMTYEVASGIFSRGFSLKRGWKHIWEVQMILIFQKLSQLAHKSPSQEKKKKSVHDTETYHFISISHSLSVSSLSQPWSLSSRNCPKPLILWHMQLTFPVLCNDLPNMLYVHSLKAGPQVFPSHLIHPL